MQIADCQADDEKLGDPDIGIIIQNHVKTGPLIHLPEDVTGRREHGGDDRLLLAVDDRKEQDIQKVKIDLRKVLTPDRPVIQHKKRDEEDPVLQEWYQGAGCPAEPAHEPLPESLRVWRALQKYIRMGSHIRKNPFDLCLGIRKAIDSKSTSESRIRQLHPFLSFSSAVTDRYLRHSVLFLSGLLCTCGDEVREFFFAADQIRGDIVKPVSTVRRKRGLGHELHHIPLKEKGNLMLSVKSHLPVSQSIKAHL